jgi:hypothetical protein
LLRAERRSRAELKALLADDVTDEAFKKAVQRGFEKGWVGEDANGLLYLTEQNAP